MKIQKRTLAVLAAAAAFGSSSAFAGHHASASQAAPLVMLQDMQEQARTASDDATTLLRMIREGRVSDQAQLWKIDSLKADVNQMGKEIAALEAKRDTLAPWERDAADRVLPLVQQAAANTSRVIAYFNQNRTHLWTPEYSDMAANIRDESANIERTLHDYLKYEHLVGEEQSIRAHLGEPAVANHGAE
jgi:hypothetical protein